MGEGSGWLECLAELGHGLRCILPLASWGTKGTVPMNVVQQENDPGTEIWSFMYHFWMVKSSELKELQLSPWKLCHQLPTSGPPTPSSLHIGTHKGKTFLIPPACTTMLRAMRDCVETSPPSAAMSEGSRAQMAGLESVSAPK